MCGLSVPLLKITFQNKKIILYLRSFWDAPIIIGTDLKKLPDSIKVVRRFLVPFV